jgi:SAM-dependent methyltransferase
MLKPERNDPIHDDPDDIVRSWYAEHYSDVTATADGSVFQTFMHRAMERRHGPDRTFKRVLEVGGNRGEHVPYVKHRYDEYHLTDLRVPQVDSSLLADGRVRVQACDVASIPHDSDHFDRVIATCLLHHVDSPFRSVQEMRRVTRDGGVITVLLPTDPGFAYRAGKALTSGRAARKRGIAAEHRLIGALDHRNHFGSIWEQLRYVLRLDRTTVDWMPWRVPSAQLNAFVVVNSTVRK